MSGWLAPQLLTLLLALLAMIGWCVYRVSRRGVSPATVRDWSIYGIIAVLIVVGIGLSVRAEIDPTSLMLWVTPIVTAGFVFGFPVKNYRSHAHRSILWITLSALLLLHFLFFFVVLSPSWRGNPLLIVIAGLPEMFITYVTLILVLGRSPRPAR
jgi:hypothetical protein